MADVIQQVTDANGKSFSVDVSKICDINGDLGDKASASITDSTKNRVQKVHDVEFVDQNGKAIDSMQLLKDMASGKTQVLALDVEMEATHSGKNHNYCIYFGLFFITLFIFRFFIFKNHIINIFIIYDAPAKRKYRFFINGNFLSPTPFLNTFPFCV